MCALFRRTAGSRSWPVLGCALVGLVVVAAVLAMWAQPARAAVDVMVADDALAQAVVDRVNAARAVAGEAGVTRNAALDTAAQAHAEYLVANASLWGAGFSAHQEDPGLPGFTGVTSAERVQHAGYPHEAFMEDVLRLETSASSGDSPWSADQIVTSWVDPPLHRRAILERSVLQVGFGYASDGLHHAYVLEAGQDHLASSWASAVQPYPADGQRDVPVLWFENESPDPFPGVSGEIGYPLTVFPVHGGSGFVSAELTLTRVGDSAQIPLVQSSWPANYAFAARAPLVPGTRYHAALFYTMRNQYDQSQTSGVVTWEFTTAGDPAPTTTTTTPAPPTTSTTTTAPPTTTTTTTVPPTTTTTTRPPLSFTDVPAAHPYRVAIEALSALGVVQGSFDLQGRRVFRPDEAVVRQHFAKMIVEGLGLPVGEEDVCPFPDVDRSGPGGLYPDNYVAVAAARGITRGTSLSPPRFSPWRHISRAQAVTMTVRAARSEAPDRLTAPPADYAGVVPATDPTHGDNLRWAEYNGLLEGMDLASWDPWDGADRGEVAQMLWNLIGLLGS